MLETQAKTRPQAFKEVCKNSLINQTDLSTNALVDDLFL